MIYIYDYTKYGTVLAETLSSFLPILLSILAQVSLGKIQKVKALLNKGLYILTEEGERKLFFSSEQEIIQLLCTHIYIYTAACSSFSMGYQKNQ